MAEKTDYAGMAKRCIAYLVQETQVTSRPVTSPEEAAQFVALAVVAAGDPGRECTGVLCLNSAGRVTDVRILGLGTVNQAPVYPREVARAALLSNATSVILFHNHPSGQSQPSAEDLAMTRSLREALRPLDIALHDHLILAGNQVFSITCGRTIQFAPEDRTLF
ncbi:MAG TPA: JAB domain-containing protein [Acidobacteriota bacterium]|nr:JAB domain-containing protein [Acidobacteriota bacterium]